MACAFHHDWPTASAFLQQEQEAEAAEFLLSLTNETGWPPGRSEKAVQCPDRPADSSPRWIIRQPSQHIMARFGNCVGWPDGVVSWIRRNQAKVKKLANEHGMSREAHGHAAWESLASWMKPWYTDTLLEMVWLFGALYWSCNFHWNEGAAADFTFPGKPGAPNKAGTPTIVIQGVAGCRCLERHEHLMQRHRTLRKMQHRDMELSAMWKRGVEAALQEMHKLALRRWFTFPCLFACVASDLGTAMCCAGLRRIAPDMLPLCMVPSLAELCIGWVMDEVNDEREWNCWGF